MVATKTYSSDWVCHQRRSNERDRIITALEFDQSGDFLAAGEPFSPHSADASRSALEGVSLCW